MYEVVFYHDKTGYSEIETQIKAIEDKTPTRKDARIQFKQIKASISMLKIYGAIYPFVDTKHIQGKIWELRPGNNRILYFYFEGNTYVLLHMFRKKTRKTPTHEIEKAIREANDYMNRNRRK